MGRLWIFHCLYQVLLELENGAMHHELLTYIAIFLRKVMKWFWIASFVFQYEFKWNRWCPSAPSFCLLYPGLLNQTKFIFCELFLEISQDFKIFKWQTVSLLTKVVLEKKFHSIYKWNICDVSWESWLSCLFKDCPGRPDLLNLPIYPYFLLKPPKTKK